MALVSGGKQTPDVYVNINRKITYIPHNFFKGDYLLQIYGQSYFKITFSNGDVTINYDVNDTTNWICDNYDLCSAIEQVTSSINLAIIDSDNGFCVVRRRAIIINGPLGKSVKFGSKYNNLHARKFIWKRRCSDNFVPGSVWERSL